MAMTDTCMPANIWCIGCCTVLRLDTSVMPEMTDACLEPELCIHVVRQPAHTLSVDGQSRCD